MEDMAGKALKDMSKRTLLILDKHLHLLRTTAKTVNKLKVHAVRYDLHKRAIYSRTALVGLDHLIEELEYGRSLCMDMLSAKKVPIVVDKKLKLVVNNENGGDNNDK